jgi:uncharacterized protein YcnI
MPRTTRRLGPPLLVVAALVAFLAGASSAYAHITVTAPGAAAGASDQEITFRVPVEKNVSTVGLTIVVPTTTALASVLVEPVPGWTHSQRSVKLAKPIVTDDGDISSAVSQITWTAQSGHGLAPGDFGSFTILAGQLPDAPALTFVAIQTYSDGSVVRWNQVAAPGSTHEPDNPAPVLELPAASSTSPTPTASAGTTGPWTVSIIAIVLAAAALGVALIGRRRRDRH